MMDNKLSELSKPVMYVVRTLDGSVASVKNYKYTAPKGFTSDPLYSQEYVSALQADRDAFEGAALALRDELREVRAELEAKDQALNNITELWKDANATAFERIRELKAKLATPVRLSDTTHPRCRLQHAQDVRAAGFTVEGDEQ